MQFYIVTGASRGIGASLARQISSESGTETLAVSRGGLAAPLPRCEDLRCDLSTREGQRLAVRAIERRLGEKPWQKAVLINNAGRVEPVAFVERADMDDFLRAYALNVVAPAALMQAFIRGSKSVSERSIINISSGVAQRPVQGWAAYCSSKAALDMVSQVAAAETGLRVASIYPGLVDTAMQGLIRTMTPSDFPSVQEFHDWKTQGALQDPEAVAEKILRLEREGKLPDGSAFLRDL